MSDNYFIDDHPEIFDPHTCWTCKRVFVPIDEGPFAVTCNFCSARCARRYAEKERVHEYQNRYQLEMF
jgi:hypothetical protein